MTLLAPETIHHLDFEPEVLCELIGDMAEPPHTPHPATVAATFLPCGHRATYCGPHATEITRWVREGRFFCDEHPENLPEWGLAEEWVADVAWADL